jgi:colanic acid biosynthesis glycosyl transferase WcaI
VLRIVVLNQYYPPDTSATALLAREAITALAAAGHEVTVIAGRPSYQPAERYAWRPLRVRWDGTVRVEHVGSVAFSRGTMAGRVVNYLSYLPLAWLRALTVRADALLAMTDPPVVVVIAALVAGVRRLPLIYNVRDLHPDMAAAAGLIRPGILLALWDALHRWALRRADRVIVLGDDMKRRIVAKGVPEGRVTVMRDGAVPPGGIPPHDSPVSREVRCGFPFVVMHAGNLGFAGAWDTLLAAARQLREDGVGFVFVGGGAAAGTLRQRAAGLDNVRVLPARPAAEVPALLAAGDLQVVTVRRGLEGLVVPSKLYPILGVGRPVLAVVPEESDVAAIVRAARCGWVVDPGDPDTVAAAVREALRDPARLAELGRRARAAAPQFARGPLLSAFAQVVADAASCQARRPRA